jgi:hypothetical protein
VAATPLYAVKNFPRVRSIEIANFTRLWYKSAHDGYPTHSAHPVCRNRLVGRMPDRQIRRKRLPGVAAGSESGASIFNADGCPYPLVGDETSFQ